MLYRAHTDLKQRARFQAVDLGSRVSEWEWAWGMPGGAASVQRSCKLTGRGMLEALGDI